MGKARFNVGDKVTFKPSSLLNYWYIHAGVIYTILGVSDSGRLFTIDNDKGEKDVFNIAYLNDKIENEPVVPTAWKVDGVHFTNEGNGNISIFGNGDITISIEHLKTILDTVQGT